MIRLLMKTLINIHLLFHVCSLVLKFKYLKYFSLGFRIEDLTKLH